MVRCIIHSDVFLDHESFYEGRQFGESDSQVNVHMDEGVMTASIRIGDETYHVEVRNYYLKVSLCLSAFYVLSYHCGVSAFMETFTRIR